MYDIFWYSSNLEQAKQTAIANSRTEYAWILCEAVDYTNFNLRYVPSKHEQTQCHVWGSHDNANTHTTWLLPINHINSAVANYHNEILPSKSIINGWEWITDSRIDYANFNFDWLPDRWDWDKNHAWAMRGTTQLAYTYLKREAATETIYHQSDLLFMPNNEWHWSTDDRIDYSNFDFNWLPDAWDKTLEHRFSMYGCDKLSYTSLVNTTFETTGIKYHTSTLMFKEPILKINKKELERTDLPEWVWVIDDRIDYVNFDFNWLPNAWDIDKVHCFTMKGKEQLSYTQLINTRINAVGKKFYQTDLEFIPGAADNEWIWITDDRIDYTGFDFNWLPDAWDIDKVHCFTMQGLTQLSYTRLYNCQHRIKETKFHVTDLKFKPNAADKEWAWITDPRIDYTGFDFNWLPDAFDVDKKHYFCMKGKSQLSYTYLYNTKHKQVEDKFYPADLEFIPGAASDEWVWITDPRIDYTGFDFNWLPDAWDIDKEHCFTMRRCDQLSYTKLYNSQHKIVSKKYHSSDLVFKDQAASDEWVWITDPRIDYTGFDFNWLPDAWDIDKVHCFTMQGCQQLHYTKLYNSKYEIVSEKYHPTDLKFKPDAANDEWVWVTDDRIDYTGFDFNWLPDAWELDKDHWFAMQGCEKLSYTRLYNSRHTQTSSKFHESVLVFKPQAAAEEWIWHTDNRIDYTDFDFNWLPDAWDIDKVHCFTMAGCNHLHYTWLVNVNHQDSTFQKIHKANLKFKPDAANGEWVWVTDPRIDYTGFDFSWLPDTWDINKEHNFSMRYADQLSYTKLYNSKHVTQGKTYHSSKLTFIDGAADDEWVWEKDPRIDYSDFDFNWLPDGWDIDKEHCFTMNGCEKLHYTKLYNKKHNKGTKKYHPAGLTFIEGAATDEWVWDIDERIDYSWFDFTWLPDEWDTDKTHYFCMEDKKQLSYTCLRNIKVESIKDVYHESHLNFKEEPRTIFWPDYITHEQQYEWLCSQYIEDEWVWVCDSRINYDNLNKRWLPDAWDLDKIHCMTMRNQKQLSYTWLVNTKTLQNKDFKYYKSALKFEKSIQDKVYWPNFVTEVLSGFDWQDSLANWVIAQELENEWVWIIDSRVDYEEFDFTWLPDTWDNQFIHCFAMKGKEKLSYTWLVNTKTLTQKKFKYHKSDLFFNDKITDLIFLDMGSGNTSGFTADKKIRFTGNMEAVVQSAVKRSNSEWVWVCSSCCDYSNFKFNWLPDLDKLDFAHCWPTPTEIKGETFLVHVPTFLRTNEFKWDFNHEPVMRYPWPQVEYTEDSLANALKKNKSSSLYTVYTNNQYIDSMPTPCLWENRPVVSMNDGNSVSLVPRDCVIQKEVYEYPHILWEKTAKKNLIDVIFISYDETQADANWEIVKNRVPRAKRLHGVKGMERALEAAAKLSSTDFFYAVFAKTRLHETFDFKFVPDYFQKPKHYIFNCINTMNKLEYGHMGIIMYNKNIILDNIDKPFGLDYTMSWEHAVVPIVSCYGEFNTTAFQTWRTAFRECCKIPYYNSLNPSIEAPYRLRVWQTRAEGEYAEWCIRGAIDGAVYYAANKNNYERLKKTFDWQWLRNYFVALYGDIE